MVIQDNSAVGVLMALEKVIIARLHRCNFTDEAELRQLVEIQHTRARVARLSENTKNHNNGRTTKKWA